MVVLDSEKSDILRCNFIKRFVTTDSTYYKEKIKQKIMFSDGLCYTGYLWDCLLNPYVIPKNGADKIMQGKRDVFIMLDIHSCDMIFIPDYWKFPKTRVLYADTWLDSFKNELPEDIYLFDETFNWSIIYTHETDANEKPYCLLVY